MKSVALPIDFDGAKFAERYGLDPFDFWADGGTLHYPDHLPDQPVFEASDPLNVRARARAKLYLDSLNQAQHVLLRGLALVTLDEVNLLRQWLAAFKAEVAAASSLADLKTRVATLNNLGPRTAAQIKTAIRSKIDGGTAD